MVTREDVVGKLKDYLEHCLGLAELVDWAEEAMQEEEFEEAHFDAVRDAIARLGLADVRAFGLSWEDCKEILDRLGYQAKIEITAAR